MIDGTDEKHIPVQRRFFFREDVNLEGVSSQNATVQANKGAFKCTPADSVSEICMFITRKLITNGWGTVISSS